LKLLASLPILLTLSACAPGKSRSAVSGPELLFSISNFQTSKLMALKQQSVSEVASSLSSDPIVLGAGEEIFLFNRQQTNLNFNKVNLSGSTSIVLSNQTSSSPLKPGDPTSTALLPGGDFLLAGYSSGALFRFSPSAKTIKTVELSFNTSGEPFRPYDLIVRDVSGKTKIFILHHGLSVDFKANGSQMLFEAELTPEGDFKAVDQDLTKEGIQGLKINSTSPMFLFKDSPSPLVVGLCDSFGTNTQCTVERFSPDTNTLATLLDLSGIKTPSSLSVTEGLDESSLLLIAQSKAAGLELKKISLSGTAPGTETTLYPLPNETYQSFLKSDLKRKKIYLGASKSLIEFQGETYLKTHTLDFDPYNGIVMP